MRTLLLAIAAALAGCDGGPGLDGGETDASSTDAPRVDASDAGLDADASERDAGALDAGLPDAGLFDVGPSDAGEPDAGPLCTLEDYAPERVSARSRETHLVVSGAHTFLVTHAPGGEIWVGEVDETGRLTVPEIALAMPVVRDYDVVPSSSGGLLFVVDDPNESAVVVYAMSETRTVAAPLESIALVPAEHRGVDAVRVPDGVAFVFLGVLGTARPDSWWLAVVHADGTLVGPELSSRGGMDASVAFSGLEFGVALYSNTGATAGFFQRHRLDATSVLATAAELAITPSDLVFDGTQWIALGVVPTGLPTRELTAQVVNDRGVPGATSTVLTSASDLQYGSGLFVDGALTVAWADRAASGADRIVISRWDGTSVRTLRSIDAINAFQASVTAVPGGYLATYGINTAGAMGAYLFGACRE